MIKSIISLDLGGKNTGFFSFTSNNILNIDDFQSGTIIYDESFGLSQVIRRGKRHTKRNNLRNKLVKRLFLLILQKHYGLKIDFLPDEVPQLFFSAVLHSFFASGLVGAAGASVTSVTIFILPIFCTLADMSL